MTWMTSSAPTGIALTEAAARAGVPLRTAQRWLSGYREAGLAGLARRRRADAGHRSLPEQQVALIEGLALRRPALSAATIHRQVLDLAGEHGWPRPSYSTVYSIITGLDPAMMTLAHEVTKRYEEVYELVYRRQATRRSSLVA